MQNNTIPQQISITNLKRPEERWGILGVLSFCHFANDYYAMVVPPLLPFIAKDFHLSYFQAGLLVFMANIISAFLQPAIGYFADLKMLRKLTISFGSRPLLLLTLLNGLVLAVFIGFTTFLPFYSEEATCSIPASWWLPLTLLPGIISQPVGGLIADKIGRRNLILFALCLLVAGLFGSVYSAGSVALAFSMLIGFCLGMLAPVCFIFAAELAVGDRVGTAVGILWGFAMAMGALAPLWVGYLRDIFPDFRIAFMSLVLVALGAAVLSAFLPGKQALREFQSPTSSTVQP